MSLDKVPVHILLVDDDKTDRKAFERFVHKSRLPYIYDAVGSKREALELIETREFDVVVLDYHLGDGVGLDLVPELAETPVIFVTGAGSEEIAIQAMRRGATDYLVKDSERQYLTMLPNIIRGVIQRKEAEQALRKSEERYRGLAEFADAVIHNVGNVLNSVNASCESIAATLNRSRIGQLERVNHLLQSVSVETDFFVNHPKGKQIPDYLTGLKGKLTEEHEKISEEIDGILKRLLLVREIIETQQSHGKVREASEPLNLLEMVEDAIKVRRATLVRNRIQIAVDVSDALVVSAPKIKLTHILINLLKNAIDAICETDQEVRQVRVAAQLLENGDVQLLIADTGIGISDAVRERLFQHGFTTKKNGHGYGLHYCANIMKELGGRVEVESDGLGTGATVNLFFPSEGVSLR
ncbi:Response regulator [Sulfidibacter corallicola]|uniref:histidine kinase n=1 Tax=Sulfidibacter corallicola TaxID=2818388 RepID=A0A8A4TFX2_SULCO|nr:hybrid sensor histidine kinase/response regulator [Sulfidibacter corallicola]QTD47661.1 response regulator [Sulfidibacter corallicola]